MNSWFEGSGQHFAEQVHRAILEELNRYRRYQARHRKQIEDAEFEDIE